MASHFTLTLDTQAPANPTLLLNSGAAMTGAREVAVALSTSDYQAGARDVAQMRAEALRAGVKYLEAHGG